MGSAASSNKKRDGSLTEPTNQKILLQRKVTTDILEKLARALPTAINSLSHALNLEKRKTEELQWLSNLAYLEEWKKWKKDDATIGNLIRLLKAAGHKPDVYQCLFNISRQPKNASTITENTAQAPSHISRPTTSNPPPSAVPSHRSDTAHTTVMDESLDSWWDQPHKQGDKKRAATNQTHSKTSMKTPQADDDIVETILLPHDHKLIQEDEDYIEALPQIESRFKGICSKTDLHFNTPMFPPEKHLSSLVENLKHQVHDEALHTWTDYRDWEDVVATWKFGLKQDGAKDKTRPMGEYLPGIALANQTVVVTDTKERALHMFTTSGQLMQSVSTGNLIPGGICCTSYDTIAVSCGTVVALWNLDGEYMGEFGRGMFGWCRGICIDHTNRFIISDIESNTVTIHSMDGHLITRLHAVGSNQFNRPYYVMVNHRNQILVCDSRNHCIKMFDKNGHYLSKFGVFGTRVGELRAPLGLCTDCCGNILVCDYGNQRVSMFSSGGWFLRNFLTKANNIGQPVSLVSFGKRKLALSVMGASQLRAFEFNRAGERTSLMLDYMQ